ncbi:UV radiation resistance-associated gene protein [Brachyhypopomus gauderio]|uniref:UV radiation resistance-associated gene protein n=1 Tax=Brachyhypopomus gauderio TaxID=698409 RepID=UPI0040437338
MSSVWDLAVSSASVGGTAAASSRTFHVDLTSQQRRLRHLRSIAARNIVNRNHSPLLDTYFTLHLCLGDRISRDFYRSEIIRDSLNPTWRSLDFAMLPELLDTSVSCFVVRIWGGRTEQYQLLIEWKVNLDGLRYTGQQIRSRNPNEIIFGLNDGYYAADFDQKDSSEGRKNSLLQVDQSSVRNSYSVFSLLRLHTAQRVIKQTQVTVQNIGKEIEEKLQTTALCTEQKKERESMQLRLGALRSELERQKKALVKEMDALQKERGHLQRKEEAFSTQRQKLEEERSSLADQQKECTAKRETFLKSNAQLTFRCRQLVSELSYIYPINVNQQSDYVICGVRLPNSEDFQAKDDGSVAVALGYTAHLVLMISCFLQIPLRYPIIQRGSRSSVKDTITDKLTDKEREFPLYTRGERFQFEYGVYLLNKNIAQLRYQHGLSTPDLRQTLPNLKHFLEHGLLVRCDRHHVSSSIPVPSKTHASVSAVPDVGPPASPDRGPRKRASSEADKQKYKTPPPSYNTATAQPCPPAVLEVPPTQDTFLSSLLDTSAEQGRESGPPDVGLGPQTEAVTETDLGQPGETTQACLPSAGSSEHTQHPGTMNGSAVPGENVVLGDVGTVMATAEVCCSVEQAEEIMGTEATELRLGLGLGLGLGGGPRLHDFPCIPVDHAVAVESDDQVLGELDAAGFEEFSRRIYALNENMSSFRRPRKNSDK